MVENMYTSLTLDELQYLAGREGVKGVERYGREELIELLDEIWEEKIADRKQNNDIMRLKGKTLNIYREDLNSTYRQVEYTIPEHYTKTSIQLLLRDPYWVFAYWDINQFQLQKLLEEFPDTAFFLRVYELKRVLDSPDDAIANFDIPVKAEDSSWYINLPNPGRWYVVDLFYESETGNEMLMCRSHHIESPGGYWLNHAAELDRSNRDYKLFFAGYSGIPDNAIDNILIQKVITEIESSDDEGGE